jgi:hypothetical protein
MRVFESMIFLKNRSSWAERESRDAARVSAMENCPHYNAGQCRFELSAAIADAAARSAAYHVEQRSRQRAVRVSQGLEDCEVISALDRQQVSGKTAFGPRLSVLYRLAA